MFFAINNVNMTSVKVPLKQSDLSLNLIVSLNVCESVKFM